MTMTSKDVYERTQDEFKILEFWKIKGSSVVRFIQALEEAFDVTIHYRLGGIVDNTEDNFMKEVTLRFVLNHEIIIADSIYYDDRQFFVRVLGDLRIRRINLKVIREVQYNNKIFSMNDFQI